MIRVTIKDYAKCMERMDEIRKRIDCYELLTKSEHKQYRKQIGKLSWHAQGTRPDLSYRALKMSKKKATATIADQ